MSGRICAIAGGKGGVGKTTAVANIATALSAAGYGVVVVDIDLGMADLGTVLYFDGEMEASIHDVLADEAEILEATYSTDLGFSVVPGSQTLDKYASADPSQLESPITQLTNVFDVVLLDTSSGLSRDVMVPLGFADNVALVTTPNGVVLRDAAKTGELIRRVGGSVSGIIVNRFREDEETESILADLGDELLGTVPEDEEITMSRVIARTGSPAARSFSAIAAQLVGVEQLEETDGEYAAIEPRSEPTSAIEAVDDEDETAVDDENETADKPEKRVSPPSYHGWAGAVDIGSDSSDSDDDDSSDETSEGSDDADSPSEPIPTAAYDDSESEESFFDEEDERSRRRGRLRHIIK